MPIYKHFKEAQENKIPLVRHLANHYEEIYSDIELEYNISLLTQQVPECEGKRRKSIKVAYKYFEKTISTLRVLMCLLGIEFHF
jgi:hypothetical protein